MDLQTRKLNLIIYLAQLKDESFLDKIEEYILSNLEKEDHPKIFPFSIENLINRIEKSEDDFQH
ncbi:hypothetical protein H9Q08_10090 [Chryseobacterium sp. PS-8]|uniref:Uncharacterized protein n=1 Tax=Chryseobacterium indicum TaxID=2766954 RepID=A0ABS9C774_9FLAO|nr:hypothetical protein [Chryseobacterium sp. PS-8]MCF2219658.1 hypothetical protein [Chryseobacterium sp. PS-8]